MRWLLDVNVVLDVLVDREPWADSAAEVLGYVERGEATGYLAAHTVTTLYDLLSSHRKEIDFTGLDPDLLSPVALLSGLDAG